MKENLKINGFMAEVSKEIDSLENKLNYNKTKVQENACLIIKSANEWIDEAKNRPIPNMLFSQFWYENELCILFADTNIGKSILAVQLADSISSGKAIHGFRNECTPKKVLYLDFELSDKQFENRCSDNYTNHYEFNFNFLRAEINPETDIPKEFKGIEDFLMHSLAKTIANQEAKVIIIDNLTYLKTDNERAKDASELMKLLLKLTRSSDVSILVLAHTPKRDASKPITENDLAGSKMLMNFCDSSFTIGGSSIDPTFRYLKQIKQRNTEKVYHTNNVAVCVLKKSFNFLCFEFTEFGSELQHLKQSNYGDVAERDELMKELIAQGLSNVKIGEELGLSEGAIRKRKKALSL